MDFVTRLRRGVGRSRWDALDAQGRILGNDGILIEPSRQARPSTHRCPLAARLLGDFPVLYACFYALSVLVVIW